MGKKVSLRSWKQYLQQVHLPKSQKLQRGVSHAKNMALWADMVTNQSMVTSLKMTITNLLKMTITNLLKMTITNLLSMDWYPTMEHLSTVETTVTVKVTDTRITNRNPATEVTAATILNCPIQALLDKKEKVSRFIFVLMILFSTVILNILS